jgi:hypothetical protein
MSTPTKKSTSPPRLGKAAATVVLNVSAKKISEAFHMKELCLEGEMTFAEIEE